MYTVKFNDQFNITCKGKRFIATVQTCFILVHPDEEGAVSNNSAIFDLLGVDKYKYCEEAYGYAPALGSWPECNPKDFAALGRVLEALAREPEVFIEVRAEKSSSSLLKLVDDELTAVKKERAANIFEIQEYEKSLELARKKLTVLTEKYEKLLKAYDLIKSI